MLLDDVGLNSQRLAGAIHDQLGATTGAVPVERIAQALDILEVRREPLRNIQGALITTPERGYGQILVNDDSTARRQRFTIAHELGHFLNGSHRQTADGGFCCTSADMRVGLRGADGDHARQEAEANAFAIELLAPVRRLERHLRRPANLEAVLAIAEEFDISREASARRWVELHSETLAAMFSHDGVFLYAAWSADFPRHLFRRDDRMPELPQPAAGSKLSDLQEVDTGDWLKGTFRGELFAQTLHQQKGFAITLLVAEPSDDDGVDDVFDRFRRDGK
jgi:hypothetical protein